MSVHEVLLESVWEIVSWKCQEVVFEVFSWTFPLCGITVQRDALDCADAQSRTLAAYQVYVTQVKVWKLLEFLAQSSGTTIEEGCIFLLWLLATYLQ